MESKGLLKNYSSIIFLLCGIVVGSISGLMLGKQVEVIKPIGDLFLNLLFTAVIPLIFFAIASSVANIEKSEKIGRLLIIMIFVFLSTMFIAALLAILAALLFPVHQNAGILSMSPLESIEKGTIGEQITKLLTVDDFSDLISRKNMLAFTLFSFLVGIATLRAQQVGEDFRRFLNAGNEMMKQLLQLIMKFAPLGLGAHFAYQVGVFGPDLFGIYAKSVGLGYGISFFYFVAFFSLYAFIAGGVSAVKVYWKNNITPSLTALGTCSSIASVPANLEAAEKMRIPAYIRNIVIPLGSSLHKEGSSVLSIIKIVVLFAVFGKDLTDVDTILLAIGISLIVSVAEGGVPNGGCIGEALVVAMYGLPMEALSIAIIISTLLDPIATLLSVSGDTVAAMLIARFSEGKDWACLKAGV